jgi:hypothetical protein
MSWINWIMTGKKTPPLLVSSRCVILVRQKIG